MRLGTKEHLLLLAAAVAVISFPAAAQAPQKHDEALTLLIPGIHDEASKQWMTTGATIAPTNVGYVVEINGAQPSDDLKQQIDAGQIKVVNLDMTHAASVNDAIRQTETQDAIAKISAEKSATVILDMHLGLTDISQKTWGFQTEFTGALAAKLTEAHERQHQNSYNVLMGHSAGTEAVRVAQRLEGPKARTLFNLSIAASPRRIDGFGEGTVMIVADGDFWYSPNGNIPTKTIFSTMSEKDAVELARHYIVVRIPANSQLPTGARAAQAAVQMVFPVASSVDRLETSLLAHQKTQEMFGPIGTVALYPRHGSDHVDIHTTSLGGLLNQITEHPLLLNGNSEQRLTEAQVVRKERAWLEPTKDIGGISLNAVAVAPFDAGEVVHGAFDPDHNRVVLLMRDGDQNFITLPDLSIEDLQACYRTAYLNDAKPEVSIGSPPASLEAEKEDRTYPSVPDRTRVYYLGGIEGTELGKTLYQADDALGELAFGSTATVRDVEDRVVGFHSLPELFLEKYTEHPAQDFYLSSITVYVNSEGVEIVPARSFWSRLWPFSSSENYELSAPTFTVRFGRNAGPAEVAFATFFTAHFNQIAGTKLGRPLGNLTPFAEAAAIFRWLRANQITMDAGPLANATPNIATPVEVSRRNGVHLTDVSPSAPAILFNSFGPNEIHDAKGQMTVIRYRSSQPIEVRRNDGTTLRILRDALGVPMILTDGIHAEMFDVDPDIGLILATNVEIRARGDSFVSAMTTRTIRYPISQREPIVATAIARFSTTNGDEWLYRGD